MHPLKVAIAFAICAVGLPGLSGRSGRAQGEHFVFVASEAADRLSLVRFSAGSGAIVRETATGIMPTAIDGPHGLAVAPDGRFYYVSLAHGQPFGALWKYSTEDDRVVGRVTLGLFPATMQVSPGGDFVYVVNFNLHGDHVPSSVSVVETSEMQEIRRIPTCVMPHGSRLDPSGAWHYSACMMDDTLVEIDTARLRVARHLVVTKGQERGADGPPPHAAPATQAHQGHAAGPACSPTWAQPSGDGRSVFVACNGSNELVEVDVAGWRVLRRIPARSGIYNLAVTGDGKLVATNRRDQSASIYALDSGRELFRVPLPRRAPHGIAVSPEDRYAFVTVEGVGSEPGTVVMIDLHTGKAIAAVDVPPQAGGIDYWRPRSAS